jgi:hypothetical protein
LFAKNTTNPIVIKGNFNSFSSALIRFKLSNSLFSNDPLVIEYTANITKNEISTYIPKKASDFYGFSVDITFNGGVNYHSIENFKILDYEISSVSPVSNIQKVFLIFDHTLGLIQGNGFTKNVKLIFKNSYLHYDMTNISKVTVDKSTEIRFIAPPISYFNLTYTPQFPFTFDLGLSFNDGFDYKYIKFVYVKTCKFSKLTKDPQSIFTGINPSVTPSNQDFSVTIFGLNLDLTQYCSIYDPKNFTVGAELFEIVPTFQTNSSANCRINYNAIRNLKSVKFTIKNQFNELNDASFDIVFYGNFNSIYISR